MIHDWLHQPGYGTLFAVSFLASTLLPLGSEWLLVMMLVSGYGPFSTVAVATVGNYLGALTTYLIGMYGGMARRNGFARITGTAGTRPQPLPALWGFHPAVFMAADCR